MASILASVALASPPPLNASNGINPADFRYTTFASGLNYPLGMQALSDGSLLAVESTPDSSNNGFYQTSGSLVRFFDVNGDGVADNPAGTVVYSGLPGTLTSMQQAGNLLFITSSGANPSINCLQMNSPTSYTLMGTENFNFPQPGPNSSWDHTTYSTLVSPTPGVAGSFDLYFNIGSQVDSVTTPATTTVAASGLFSATLHGDSIYKVTVSDTGTPAFSGVQQIAYGLRNSAGMAFQPGTGNLYLDDNGIDNGVNDPTYNETGKQYSADEINMIPASQVGTTLPDFGFAHSVILESTGQQAGDGAGVQPLQTFRATASGAQSEGPNEIAFVPSNFPDDLAGGILVTFQGNSDYGTANEQNPLVFYDPTTNSYYHLIEAGQAGLGHIDGVLSTSNAIFMSDLDTDGDVYDSSGAGTGAIYELIPIPEPGSFRLLALSLPVFLSRRKTVAGYSARKI